MTKKIKHIFFDLDHTLWDFDKNSALTFHKIFELHNIDINTDAFLNAYEPINFKYWKLYREEKVTKSQLRYGRLNDSFTRIGVKVSDVMIDKLSEDYITHLTTFHHVFDDTHNVLKYLEKKYILHIITNGFEEAQEKKMKISGLRHFFKTVTNSEMVGVKKPNPKIFNFALKKANASLDESVMIGDNLEADIQGALDVGMQAIHFDFNNVQHSTNYKRITKLKELKLIF